MIKIAGSYGIALLAATGPSNVNEPDRVQSGREKKMGTTGQSPSLLISSLSARLSLSEGKNEKQVGARSGEELRKFAVSVIDEVSYPLTADNVARAQKELPSAADPHAVESAKAANAFVNSQNSHNPFSALSGDQLSAIYSDQSGTFTLNERRTAYTESARREQEWRVKLAAQAVQEYNKSGKLTDFFSQALEHFNNLSLLEKALYPKNYSLDLQAKIDLDFNYLTGQSTSHGDKKVENSALPPAVSSDIQQALSGPAPILPESSLH